MRQTKGFSLLELLVTLGIITILATVAVPRVNIWIARNRGLQMIMEIHSDFSKAKSIAESTVLKNDGRSQGEIEITDTNGEVATINLGTRPHVAMFFWKDGYKILQKESPDELNWDKAEALKTHRMLKNVEIIRAGSDDTNNNLVSTDMVYGMSNAKYVSLTATGVVKDQLGNRILFNNSEGQLDLTQSAIFYAEVESRIGSDEGAICYRLIVGSDGRYSIHRAFSTGDCKGVGEYKDYIDI